ncbi:MAG: heme ABC transporter permease CcmC [Pseudomonadota bacterium]
MHGFANPNRFLSIAKPLTPFLLVSGIALVAIALWMGLFATPADRLMGETVRIMYIHVPAAWLGMAGWTSIAIASLVELVWRHPLAGIAARASALPGAFFALICLITGAIWARPTWGTWWVWDGRLTSMLVLFLLYLGYMAIAAEAQKEAAAGRSGTARIAAIFGMVGAISVPIVNRSVEWWNSLHQPASISVGKTAIDAAFLWPLAISVLGFSLIFGALILLRMRQLLAEIRVEARMRRKAVA